MTSGTNTMNSKLPNLKQVFVIHDNCSRGCTHCFCKSSSDFCPSDIEQTEAVVSSLKSKGYEVHPYVTDPGKADVFEKFIKPFGYNTVEMKDSIDHDIVANIPNDGTVTVGFSLHGHNAATHEMLCGKGNFNKTIEALQLAQKQKLKNIRVYSVIYIDNYSSIEELCELLKKYSVSEVIFLRLGYGGRAQQLSDKMFLDNNAYREFFEIFKKTEVINRGKIKLSLDSATWGPYNSTVKIKILQILGLIIKKQYFTCDCGHKKVTLDPRTKKIYPCSLMIQADIGNMGYYDEERGLIINNFLWLNDLADKIGEPCKSCKLMWFCGGHCRVAVIENNHRITKKVDIYSGHSWCPVALGIRKPFRLKDLFKVLRGVLTKIDFYKK